LIQGVVCGSGSDHFANGSMMLDARGTSRVASLIRCITSQTARLEPEFLHGFARHGHERSVWHGPQGHESLDTSIQSEPVRGVGMGKRDARADLLDDDPFRNSRAGPRIHRVHQHQAPDGTVHFETSSAFSNALMQFLGQDTWEKPKHHTGRLWHFSDVEKQHLRLAMGAFTLALGLMAVGGISGISFFGFSSWVVFLLLSMPVWLIGVGPAFLLHEIGHKLVAKRYGCWAEFRADPKGLQFGILLAFVIGFLFMAPGAVMVAGLVSRRQNGHIAVAGPLTNFCLFLIGIPLWGILIGLTGAHIPLPTEDFGILGWRGTYVVDNVLIWQAMVFNAGVYWIVFNLVLGLFNMLPIGPLDGLKVKDWSNGAFFTVIGVFALLVFTMYTGAWSASSVLTSVAEPVSNLVR